MGEGCWVPLASQHTGLLSLCSGALRQICILQNHMEFPCQKLAKGDAKRMMGKDMLMDMSLGKLQEMVRREDSGLLSRVCNKRKPTSRDDVDVSWV